MVSIFIPYTKCMFSNWRPAMTFAFKSPHVRRHRASEAQRAPVIDRCRTLLGDQLRWAYLLFLV